VRARWQMDCAASEERRQGSLGHLLAAHCTVHLPLRGCMCPRTIREFGLVELFRVWAGGNTFEVGLGCGEPNVMCP
jgi:hypothetical protein